MNLGLITIQCTPFYYKPIAKKQKAQRANRFISMLCYFLFGGLYVNLYVNLILICTWLTYNDYTYSAGVGQLRKNMCLVL